METGREFKQRLLELHERLAGDVVESGPDTHNNSKCRVHDNFIDVSHGAAALATLGLFRSCSVAARASAPQQQSRARGLIAGACICSVASWHGDSTQAHSRTGMSESLSESNPARLSNQRVLS
jgi:hypothetical protein